MAGGPVTVVPMQNRASSRASGHGCDVQPSAKDGTVGEALSEYHSAGCLHDHFAGGANDSVFPARRCQRPAEVSAAWHGTHTGWSQQSASGSLTPIATRRFRVGRWCATVAGRRPHIMHFGLWASS